MNVRGVRVVEIKKKQKERPSRRTPHGSEDVGESSPSGVVCRRSPGRTPRTVAKLSRDSPRGDVTLVPKGYTMRPVVPAKNYDVVSFARAMNDDFAPRVQKLFEPETNAALAAVQTGVYIGWRCPEFKHDCQRVGQMSKCFCGHLLGEHKPYNGRSVRVPCKQSGCACLAFAWIPSRPEDIGEFWFERRRDFDVTKWRAKCRCKHTHEQHESTKSRMCKSRGCGCACFDSNFLCSACDRHWEDHETFFETESMRRQNGLPCGQDYLPFTEMPDLRNAALTGDERNESAFLALTDGTGAIPDNKPTDNNTVVSAAGGRFRPIYD